MTARTVIGRAGLAPDDGPILASIGVFDGLHLGHRWLLQHLVHEAGLRSARPTVITFDAHPDAVLLGSAPPLLMDPAERLERLGALGVDLVVIEHFDDALRTTPYDAFVAGISDRCRLVGFVMTPDAAFGHERKGTPAALAELGRTAGFDVVLVPPFTLAGREVRSSEIRAAIANGNFGEAERLLGRPYAVRGTVRDGALTFAMPVALPPAGAYDARVAGRSGRVEVEGGLVRVDGPWDGEDVEVVWRR
ncbi:MAG TPA: FAD synthetase family protein [Candidatus Limnocylindrales bacterium]